MLYFFVPSTLQYNILAIISLQSGSERRDSTSCIVYRPVIGHKHTCVYTQTHTHSSYLPTVHILLYLKLCMNVNVQVNIHRICVHEHEHNRVSIEHEHNRVLIVGTVAPILDIPEVPQTQNIL